MSTVPPSNSEASTQFHIEIPSFKSYVKALRLMYNAFLTTVSLLLGYLKDSNAAAHSVTTPA